MLRLVASFFLLTSFLLNSSVAIAYEKEIKNLAASMGDRIGKAGKKTIAVVDFTDLQGNVTELGRFIAEELSVDLSELDKGFEVVDRTHLKSLIREHKLSASGLIDPQTAGKLGQIAGVDALVTGTITPFGDSVRVSAKILDTSKAKVISASSCDIAKTKAIEELLSRGIESSQSSSSQETNTNVSSYSGNSQSKKVGKNITLTIKKIAVSNGRVLVHLDVLNNSDKVLKIVRNASKNPNIELMDDRGNIFLFEEGLVAIDPSAYWMKVSTNPFYSTPKVNSYLLLKFNAKRASNNQEIKEIGSIFTLATSLNVYDTDDDSVSTQEVSFVDIKAQKLK